LLNKALSQALAQNAEFENVETCEDANPKTGARRAELHSVFLSGVEKFKTGHSKPWACFVAEGHLALVTPVLSLPSWGPASPTELSKLKILVRCPSRPL
jgi:hypothetical protein